MKNILICVNNEVSLRAHIPIIDCLDKSKFSIYAITTDDAGFIKKLKQSKKFYSVNEAQGVFFDGAIINNPFNRNNHKIGTVFGFHHGNMYGNNSWSLKTVESSDYFFGLSDVEFDYISKELGRKFQKEQYFTAGCLNSPKYIKYREIRSKCDESVNDIKDKLELEKYKKTILITSHWTSNSNHRYFGVGLIDSILYYFPDCNIIITAHPKLFENPKSEFKVDRPVKTPNFDSEYLVNRMKKMSQNKSIYFFQNHDPAELLTVSDVIVSDYSSVIAEAAFIDVPIVARYGNYYYNREVRDFVFNAAYLFNNIETLVNAVKAGLEKPFSKKEGREILRKMFGGEIKNSNEIICRTIEKILLSDSSPKTL